MLIHTIRTEDVGKLTIDLRYKCHECGHTVGPVINTQFMGGIRSYDVGKQIHQVKNDEGTGTTFQVENQEQLEARTGKPI